MSEKQDRQGVRKASELEQKYKFGQKFDKVNGAVVAATRAATNANAAASSANAAAAKADAAATNANAAAEEARQLAERVGLMITGVLSEDRASVELDKSFDEIWVAVQQKRKCTVVVEDDGFSFFELVSANDERIQFQQITPEGVLVSMEITSNEESQ